MGVVIYFSGKLSVSDHTKEDFPKNPAKKAVEAITEIKDRWGNPVFKLDGYVLNFAYEMIEGCDPVTDYVETLIKQAIKIANQNDAYIVGHVDITSDWNDYDNIHLDISEAGSITHGNSEIINASDDELIAELEKRGYVVKKSEIYAMEMLGYTVIAHSDKEK